MLKIVFVLERKGHFIDLLHQSGNSNNHLVSYLAVHDWMYKSFWKHRIIRYISCFFLKHNFVLKTSCDSDAVQCAGVDGKQ